MLCGYSVSCNVLYVLDFSNKKSYSTHYSLRLDCHSKLTSKQLKKTVDVCMANECIRTIDCV